MFAFIDHVKNILYMHLVAYDLKTKKTFISTY